jgi:membrane-bound ClpP family serine protease
VKRSGKSRLLLYVVLLEEIILVAIVLFILWLLGIYLPLWAIITIAVALGIWLLVQYWFIVPVINKKHVTGSESMIGIKGKVITPLNPNGYIKIGSEMWQAYSTETNISTGEEVVVVGIDRLKLIVKSEKKADDIYGDDIYGCLT